MKLGVIPNRHTGWTCRRAKPAASCIGYWRNLSQRLRMGFVLPLLAGVLAWSLAAAHAPPPLPQPAFELVANGEVLAAASAPDGSVVVGGDFTTINGVTRLNIARLQSNGVVDPTWNPSANGPVQSLAVDNTGAVYAGGTFTVIGGQSRSFIAKLSGGGTGTADPNWNPSANTSAVALAVDNSSAVYAGGNFVTIGGQTHPYIAKIDALSGVVNASWNPDVDDAVLALAVDAGGDVYAGGRFATVGGQTHVGIVKIAGATGSAVTGWNPGTNSGGIVESLVINGSAVFAGGLFSNIGSQPRSDIAKLSLSTGVADATWNPTADRPVTALATNGATLVYAGGYFTSIGGLAASNIAKLAATGTGAADPNWNPGANRQVAAMALNGSGDVVAGGSFTQAGSQVRRGLVVLSGGAGTPLTATDAERPGVVYALVSQANGGVIAGGDFYRADQSLRNNLLRVAPGGTLDPAWNPGADSFVEALAVDPSGAVYAGGYFANIGGLPRRSIAKLAAGGSGAADADWNPGITGGVLALVVDNSGAAIAGGSFFNAAGQARNNLVRLLPDGTLDAEWNPLGADASVFALAKDASGAVYVGGYFQNIGGQPRADIAKLAGNTGAVDPAWNPDADSAVRALALGLNGAVFAGGSFQTIGGQARRRIAKLADTNGVVDPSWNPGADGSVEALAVDSIGLVYAGGDFDNIGGQARSGIARLEGGGTGAADATWDPHADNTVLALTFDAGAVLYVGGEFSAIDNVPHNGLAALPTELSDRIFQNGFD